MSAAGLSTPVIFGAGFLGQVLARQLTERGQRPVFATRSPSRVATLAAAWKLPVVEVDPAAPDLLAARLAGTGTAFEIYCLVPPAAFPWIADGCPTLARLVAALGRLPVVRAVLSSSIGVYGDTGGAVVTAETVPRPVTARERHLAAIERTWLDATERRVLRLAGLYGRGRVIGRDALLTGQPIEGDRQGWLNLIHAEDAAALLRACMHHPAAAAVELGSDGSPVSRACYYGHLARSLGVAPPRFEGRAARGGASRRCDPASTRRRLGWQPKYPDYRCGLGAC